MNFSYGQKGDTIGIKLVGHQENGVKIKGKFRKGSEKGIIKEYVEAKPNFLGTFLLDDKLDSVNLRINKNGSFKTIETSICSGDIIHYNKGKWKTIGDTITLITHSRTKTGQAKPKTYEWKPEHNLLMRNDTLFSLDDKKQIRAKRFYYRTK